MSWRVKVMCDNCPFRTDGAAIELREGRLADIKEGALLGQAFHCHKTVYKEWRKQAHRHWKECAGALDYRQSMWVEHFEEAAEVASRVIKGILAKSP